jgi:hypothetical protein
MIFAPVLAYVPQYQLIRQTKSLGSFSIDICAILLIGNILRIYFWFAEGFGVPLLIQSVLMIIAQVWDSRDVAVAAQGLCGSHELQTTTGIEPSHGFLDRGEGAQPKPHH